MTGHSFPFKNQDNSMLRVSILVPIYGVERFIERCSRSLFEQTYHNLEFVFVNDCTPDQSVAVLKKVMADYPNRKDASIIVNHDKNKGLAASRNTGLDHATGDFVFCVDSDDWLETNAVESLMHNQQENDADILTGGYLVHFEDGKTLLRNPRVFKDKEPMVLQMMQHTWDHFVAGRLVRRSLFVDNGLYWKEGFDVAEDRYMMTLLSYYARVSDSVDDIVYHYERSNLNALTKVGDGKRVFRNNHQELGNLLFLEEFFRDKEIVYLKECSRCIMEQLENNLQAAVHYSSQEEYNHVVRIIDGRDDADLELIDWNRSGIKGWMKHHYVFSLLSHRIDKSIRFIRKRAKAVFSTNRSQ